MRMYLIALGILAGVAMTSGNANAQLKSVPVDTNALIVKPVDTTTNIMGSTFKYLGRVTANAISSDGYIKTINNLLGRTKDTPPTTQSGGISPLPHPSMYPSNRYPSPLTQQLPRNSTPGR